MGRVGPLAAAYLTTAAVSLAAVLWLRRELPPPQLRAVLSFFFIAALSAGLEPATAKARALLTRTPPRLAAVLAASAAKALAAAPILAIAWRLADPRFALRDLLLGLVPTVVAGFWASDLRVRLDLGGRHAAALWLKQGSLALAFAGAAIGAAAGWPPAGWLALATLPRLALALGAGAVMSRSGDEAARVTTLLADRGWTAMALTSALAAAGGSMDRLAGLSLLTPAAYAGYYLLYELLSRFWVVPYLATPVLFARLAAGRDSRDLRRRLWLGITLGGAGLVLGVALAAAFAPALIRAAFGTPVGWPAVAFASAIVLAALTQIVVADLQGRGAVRHAALVVGGGALLSAALFWVFARTWGVDGLLCAWLVKSAAELAAATLLNLASGAARAPVPKLP